MEFDYMELVELGISYGFLVGVVVPFAGWAIGIVFRVLKSAFS